MSNPSAPEAAAPTGPRLSVKAVVDARMEQVRVVEIKHPREHCPHGNPCPRSADIAIVSDHHGGVRGVSCRQHEKASMADHRKALVYLENEIRRFRAPVPSTPDTNYFIDADNQVDDTETLGARRGRRR